MAQRVPLPKITDCSAPVPRSVSINDSRVAQALFVFVVFALLCVGHIYLRFSIREVSVEHSRLQQQRHALEQQVSRLQLENESLCDSSRLRAFARRELHMLESDPRTQLTAVIPGELRQKYATGPATTMIASIDRPEVAPLKRFWLSLVDVNKAFAAQRER